MQNGNPPGSPAHGHSEPPHVVSDDTWNNRIHERDDIRLSTLLRPIIRNWKLMAGIVTAACTVAVIAALARPRKYEASVTMAAISGSMNVPLGMGVASSLLGAVNSSGLRATPALIVRLSELHSVVYPVALSTVDSGKSSRRVIDRLVDEDHAILRYDKVGEELRRVVKIDYDRQTGVISLVVTHQDSALTRIIADRMVDAISSAFLSASRSQAAELRHAQDARVDSAANQLATAERTLVKFLSANRSIPPYSILSVERDRLQRAISMAQTIYTQAATDREAAIAKELEQTPAVVVLDPIPDQLIPVSRKIPLMVIVVGTLATLAVAFVLLVREAMRRSASDSHALIDARESSPQYHKKPLPAETSTS